MAGKATSLSVQKTDDEDGLNCEILRGLSTGCVRKIGKPTPSRLCEAVGILASDGVPFRDLEELLGKTHTIKERKWRLDRRFDQPLPKIPGDEGGPSCKARRASFDTIAIPETPPGQYLCADTAEDKIRCEEVRSDSTLASYGSPDRPVDVSQDAEDVGDEMPLYLEPTRDWEDYIRLPYSQIDPELISEAGLLCEDGGPDEILGRL